VRPSASERAARFAQEFEAKTWLTRNGISTNEQKRCRIFIAPQLRSDIISKLKKRPNEMGKNHEKEANP
jgi:hypothetical protein